jgi:outer membrane protein OmpA-like peptidoglycan-associated protein
MPQRITLDDVHFNTGESTLRESSYETLKELKKLLEEKASLKVMIAGHTDSRGDKASNQKLSEARAQAVVDYLVKEGVDRSRLKAKGFGESRPIASNDTPEGRQKNRRTEVRVLER